MPANLLPTNITKVQFTAALSRYPSHIPASLTSLDTFRYTTLPTLLTERISSSNPHLTKPELIQLIDWKLHHGKHRPQLAALVASNSPDKVIAATSQVFPSEYTRSTPPTFPILKASLDILTQLKGIGPASASLILSVVSPSTIPFFSDELYRYLLYESPAKGKGWDRKINYTVKEYKMLVEMIGPIMKRLGVGALEIEKVAYVLGKENVDLLVSEGEGSVGGDMVGVRSESGDSGSESEAGEVALRKRKFAGNAKGPSSAPPAAKKKKT